MSQKLSSIASRYFGPLSFLIFMLSSSVTAQTVSICRDVKELIQHPEKFVIEEVSEKVKRGGLSCVLRPTCCTPLWQTDPTCYVINVVLKKRKISEAWQEFRTANLCQDYPLDRAAGELFKGILTPTTGFRYLGAGPLVTFIDSNVAVAKAVSQPLSDELKLALRNIRVQYNAPYTDEDLNRARWIRYDHPAAVPLWRMVSTNDAVSAVTFDNLIVAGPDLFPVIGCAKTAKWAHEVVHIHQYRRDGWDPFLNRYITEGTGNGYCNISYEREAYALENEMLRDCRLPLASCSGAAGNSYPIRITEVNSSVENITKFPFTIPSGKRVVVTFAFDAVHENAVLLFDVNGSKLAERGNYNRSIAAWTSEVNNTNQSITHYITGWHKRTPPDPAQRWYASLGKVLKNSSSSLSIGFEDSFNDGDYNDIIVVITIAD